jgi:hypothetical protein
MTKSTREQKEPKTPSLKKPYARPNLIEYGSVTKLTASGGTKTPGDGVGTKMVG